MVDPQLWKDPAGHTHGELTGDRVRIAHRGRVIEVLALPGHVEITSRFSNGSRAATRLRIPPTT